VAERFLLDREVVSIGEAACVVGLLSALVAGVSGAIFRPVIRYLLAVLFPVVAATGFYWLPNLDRLHDAELRAWSLLFILFCSVPSIIVSIATVVLTSLWLRRRSSR
jgi:hypothetical protein